MNMMGHLVIIASDSPLVELPYSAAVFLWCAFLLLCFSSTCIFSFVSHFGLFEFPAKFSRMFLLWDIFLVHLRKAVFCLYSKFCFCFSSSPSFFFQQFLFCPWCRFWHQVDELSTCVPSLFNFILYKDCIEKECQCDRWPQSIIKRLQVKSQGWAMCLCGAQLSSPHYLRHSERWIRALRHSLSYQLTRGGEEEMGRGGVSPGLGCPQLLYVCLISQYINQAWLSGEPSAPAIHQDLSASHHNWEMRLWHWNSISPIRLGPTA